VRPPSPTAQSVRAPQSSGSAADRTGDRNERNEREPVHLAVLSKVAANTPLVKTEAFAPVLGFVPIGGTNGDAKAFLKAAVAFANKECYGTLSGSLMIDPRTEAAIGSGTLDEALHELKYGAIGVNDWGGTAVFKGVGRWGAAPAHTPRKTSSRALATSATRASLITPRKRSCLRRLSRPVTLRRPTRARSRCCSACRVLAAADYVSPVRCALCRALELVNK
jgi:acyl-CoA reductase-like NAD-dependent aldehyde dehydrogenase